MGVATEDSFNFSFPKNLSVWWSEETEYVLQRIERWAAYAKGYNRLRSVRLSPGRMTMQEEPDNRWSINQSTNRLVVESGWAPNFRNSRKQPPQPVEKSKLRCCALSNLDYKSNGNLDSNCLESYSLDHSIYFKTIGDLKVEQQLRPKENNNYNGNNNNYEVRSVATTPIDCGDFLSSDFEDDEDLEEMDPGDYELREQLEQLAADCDDMDECGEVIQVCKSVINEDEINNNIRMLNFSNKFAPSPVLTQVASTTQ